MNHQFEMIEIGNAVGFHSGIEIAEIAEPVGAYRELELAGFGLWILEVPTFIDNNVLPAMLLEIRGEPLCGSSEFGFGHVAGRAELLADGSEELVQVFAGQ